jgi:hypothetical protein
LLQEIVSFAIVHKRRFLVLKELFFVDKGRVACPIYLVTREGLSQWCEQYAGRQAQWVQQNGFVAERGSVLMVPDKSGQVS